MPDFLSKLFDTSDFPARWQCGTWTPLLGWTHIASDLAIFGAYMSIPWALVYFVRHRKDLPKPFSTLLWLFGGFIVACGMTHLNEAIIFWAPIYRVAGVVKAATAGVSWLTLAFLIPVIPHALALQTPDELQREVRRATDELRRERDAAAHLAAIVESSDDAILSAGLNATIESWNPGAERMLGYTADEVLGQPMALLIPEDARPLSEAAYRRAREGHHVEHFESERLRKDGTRVPVSLTISPIRGRTGTVVGVATIARDVTDQRRAASAIEARTKEKAALLDGALDAILTIDQDGTIVEFNPAAEALFGCAAQDAKGDNIADRIIPLRLRKAHRLGLARYLATGEAKVLGRRLELPAVRADGSEFTAEVSVIQLPSIDPPLFAGFIRDLTQLKRAQDELTRTVDDLKRSNRELEQFAYVASHDLQEPLRMITAYMQLIQSEYEGALDEQADTFIHFAVDGAQRMKKLVDGLLTYSRVETQGRPLTRCSIKDVVRSVVSNLSLLIEETDALVTYHELPVVWGDATQLELVFMNLIGNALKFRGEASPAVTIRGALKDSSWEITVQDNGIGFEPAHSERIFQMFQRLHDRDRFEGSGIGLAVTKRIIERHGGDISAQSTPGEGSCFTIRLPVRRIDSEK